MQQKIDAAAIRFHSLKEEFGITLPTLASMRPVVFTAHQGLAAAGTGPHAPLCEAAGATPPRTSPAILLDQPLQPPLKHQLDRVIFIIDRSSSMADPLTNDPKEIRTKMGYLRSQLAMLSEDYFDRNTQISLVAFGAEAHDLAANGPQDLRSLKRAIVSQECSPRSLNSDATEQDT